MDAKRRADPRKGQPRGPAGRSGREWAVRAALAGGALVLGYVGVTFSLAQAVAAADPARAYALAPYDGQLAARLAETRLAEAPETGGSRTAVALARASLRRDPLSVRAVPVLGITASGAGDTRGSQRLLDYAQRLSRRNLQTQLWAIEAAVARGDVTGALTQYDIALRSSRTAIDLLYPVLASAITDRPVRAATAAMLAKRPPWGGFFIDFASGNGDSPAATALLFEDLQRRGVAISPSAIATLVNRLAAGASIEAAWRFYRSRHPGADPASSRDERLRGVQTPSLFDWTVVSDANVTATIGNGTENGGFDFSVPAGTGGRLIQQTQLLPAGRYRLAGHSLSIAQAEGSLPYWVLACRDGRELGRVTVPNSATAGGQFAGQFVVPPNCPVQTLTLVARSSDQVGGVSGQIDRVRLGPAS
ncbi:hypothetical protein [Sphingomonas yantingensis]|uniref:Uncharacterized protein n=1 Tax=Sphingomonas yantingensis TaxID=1241761 RepID=A0A7W9ATA3_9SPHN|nr:hypothetical protein [Sphingomonas yantingensis]MBB5700136.1 hypothetical protein [Sphingomonas yantingensis]